MMEKILKPDLLDQKSKTQKADSNVKASKSSHHCLIILIVPFVELKQVKFVNLKNERDPIVIDVKQELAREPSE